MRSGDDGQEPNYDLWPERRQHLRGRVQDGRGRRAGDFDPKNRGGRGSAFPGTYALWVVCAGCRRCRPLIGEVAPKVLNEYFAEIRSSDVHDYGYGATHDYLKHPYEINCCDWIITNPPFRLAEDFVLKSLRLARRGVAILARTVFLESVGRYERIFSRNAPSIVAQFTERVPMVQGRLDKSASTSTGYCCLVWEAKRASRPRLVWIPPCRKSLEREGDYDLPPTAILQDKPSKTTPLRRAASDRRRLRLQEQDDLFGT
jgi:hypothetical protein